MDKIAINKFFYDLYFCQFKKGPIERCRRR